MRTFAGQCYYVAFSLASLGANAASEERKSGSAERKISWQKPMIKILQLLVVVSSQLPDYLDATRSKLQHKTFLALHQRFFLGQLLRSWNTRHWFSKMNDQPEVKSQSPPTLYFAQLCQDSCLIPEVSIVMLEGSSILHIATLALLLTAPVLQFSVVIKRDRHMSS